MRSADTGSAGIDKRASPRFPATRKVYLVTGRKAAKCSLIDIAEGGARIAITGLTELVDEMVMVDGGVSRVHLSRVVWRSDREAGLQFIASESFAGPAGGKDGALDIATRFSMKLAR